MKEITRIHLAKVPFEIEIEAKKQFEKYFLELKKCSNEEILSDVEIRIVEILAENGVAAGGIITGAEITKIRAQIGEPEVFLGEDFATSAKAEDLEQEEVDQAIRSTFRTKKLYRDPKNAVLAGVFSGLGEYFGIEATWLRVAFVILAIPTFGTSLMIYILLSIIIPQARSASDILQLRGENLTAKNLQSVNQEYNFEKLELRNKKITRAGGIIGGTVALLGALGGIFLLFYGNNILITGFNERTAYFAESSKIVIFTFSNLAGIAFVAFWANLAVAGFSNKFSKKNLAALIASILIGFSSIFGLMVGMNFIRRDYDKHINHNIEVQEYKGGNL